MSLKCVAWAIEQVLPDKPKIALIILADWACPDYYGDPGDQGEYCTPSVKDLMAKTHWSKSTVERVLKWLVDEGWMTRTPRFFSNGAQKTSLYRIECSRFVMGASDVRGGSATTGSGRTPPSTGEAPKTLNIESIPDSESISDSESMMDSSLSSLSPSDSDSSKNLKNQNPVEREERETSINDSTQSTHQTESNLGSWKKAGDLVLPRLRSQTFNIIPEEEERAAASNAWARGERERPDMMPLADDWFPNEEDVAFAEKHGVGVDEILYDFRARYDRARMGSPSNGFRSWVVHKARFKEQDARKKGGTSQSFDEAVEEGRRLREEMLRKEEEYQKTLKRD